MQLSERRLRLATEVARSGIFEWDMLRQTVTWTPGLEALQGRLPGPSGSTRSDEEWLATLHPDDVSGVASTVQPARLHTMLLRWIGWTGGADRPSR